MSPWSRLAGDKFLEWLGPAPGLRWLDIGCGTGTFTELIAEQCDPMEVHGVWEETRAAGVTPLLPPNPSAGGLEELGGLWTTAGLEAVETREIVVERTFSTFEDYWATSTITGGVRPPLEAMSVEERDKLKARVRARLPTDSKGRVTWNARANAVKGRVPNAGQALRNQVEA
jgi:hypothetical protein